MAPKSQKPFKRTATFLLLTAAKDHPVPVFDTHKLGVLSQWLNLSRLGLPNALFDIWLLNFEIFSATKNNVQTETL